MANVLVQDSTLTAIADAIRTRAGTEDTYKPAEMPDAIYDLVFGGGFNYNIHIINRTSTSHKFKIGDYVDSVNDILFMVWCLEGGLGGTGYNTAIYVKADPIENEEFPGRRPLYAARFSETIPYKARLDGIKESTQYGLGYNKSTKEIMVDLLTENAYQTNSFKAGTILLITRG